MLLEEEVNKRGIAPLLFLEFCFYSLSVEVAVHLIDVNGDSRIPALGTFQLLSELHLQFDLCGIESDDASAFATIYLLHPTESRDVERRILSIRR